ncbi:MAG: hypothetical protein ACI8QD_001953 [Cyclobacteriaceae bacterium]|jgi:hypothetical protein
MENLIPIFAIVGVFGGGVLFVKILTDFFLKRKIVEKGLATEEINSILRKGVEDNKYSGLKWGLILLSAGIGLVIINYVPYDSDTPFPYGILSICVAIGFLTYYMLVKRDQE